MLSFFPLDALDEIWDLIESVSEGFLTYSFMSTMLFLIERDKSNIKRSYDKQILILVVISYKIIKLAKGSLHKFHEKLLLV